MYFYKIEGKLNNLDDSMKDKRFAYDMQEKQSSYLLKCSGTAYVYISKIRNKAITLGTIIKDNTNAEKYVRNFIEYVQLDCKIESIEEVTVEITKSMLRTSSYNDYIFDANEIFAKFGMEIFAERYRMSTCYSENIIVVGEQRDILSEASHFLAYRIVSPELDRINSGPALVCNGGHPVHYIISTDLSETADFVDRMLISALYKNKRIKSKRYTKINMEKGKRYYSDCEDIYKISKGSTIIINFGSDIYEDSDYADQNLFNIENTSKLAEKYSNSVLTVFHIPKNCPKLLNKLYECTNYISFVEIMEYAMTYEDAKRYINSLVRENKIETDENVYNCINDRGKTYRARELKNHFNIWLSRKLKNEIYPQYSYIASAKSTAAKEKPKGSAYDELMGMIGLDKAKEITNQAIKYYKAQKLFASRGMKKNNIAMHMVFTGNPGTAKTTVARLFARIMKDNDILSVGDLFELGRSDLVGKYVGWTAQIVKSKFRAAKGSVLFIDEAYSLVDDSNSFGDEAINTIVQEMENNRQDMIVIFAGYPKEMEKFLSKNPGLRSRIAYHINFDDYNEQELYGITELITKNANMKLSKGVKEKLIPVFENALQSNDFGNGRFARNLFEKAKMKQANRLMEMDIESITDEDIATLLAEDFEIPIIKNQNKPRRIGF